VRTLQRIGLFLVLVALAFMVGAGAAWAHIPYIPSNQVGCVITSDPWALGEDGDPLTPPFGPFDGSLVAAGARNNTCGHK
jgi:hypothetical protein